MRTMRVVGVVVVVVLVGCGRTGWLESDGFGDGSGTTANTETATTATGSVFDLPSNDTSTDDTEPTETEGDGDGDPGDGDPGDGDPGDGDPGDGDPGDGDPGDGDGDPLVCGNGQVQPGEQCDGMDLNGLSCTELGYDSGELACDPIMCVYDTTACVIDMGGGGTTG